MVVDIVPTSETCLEEIEEVQALVLGGLAVMMAEKVVVGGFGTIMKNDKDKSGYYLVQWTGVPYMLQEEVQITEHNPAFILGLGELVFDAKYLYIVPLVKHWFTWPPCYYTTVVRMQHVVAAYTPMAPIAPNNKLPNNCDRLGATHLGALKVTNESYDQIIEEIYRREVLDYNEEVEDGAGLDSVLSSDKDEDKESDNASNSNIN